METASNHLEDSSHLLGRRVFDVTKFYQNHHGILPQLIVGREVMAAKPAKQMHYNDPVGDPRADVDGESTCSAPAALRLLGQGFWKPQGQDVVLLEWVAYLSLSLPPAPVYLLYQLFGLYYLKLTNQDTENEKLFRNMLIREIIQKAMNKTFA